VSAKKLALVGYGKMSRLIEQLAPEYDFEVVERLTKKNIAAASFHGVDAAIEFSTPEAARGKLTAARPGEEYLLYAEPPVGSNILAKVTTAVDKPALELVWSPNFSVGAAVFRKLTVLAAELLCDQPEYGAWAWEIHHDTRKMRPPAHSCTW